MCMYVCLCVCEHACMRVRVAVYARLWLTAGGHSISRCVPQFEYLGDEQLDTLTARMKEVRLMHVCSTPPPCHTAASASKSTAALKRHRHPKRHRHLKRHSHCTNWSLCTPRTLCTPRALCISRALCTPRALCLLSACHRCGSSSVSGSATRETLATAST